MKRSEDDIRPEDDDRFYRHMRYWFWAVSSDIYDRGCCHWCNKPWGTNHMPGCSYLIVTDRLRHAGYLSQHSIDNHVGLIPAERYRRAKAIVQIVDPASGEVIARAGEILDDEDTDRLLWLVDETWGEDSCPELGKDWEWTD